MNEVEFSYEITKEDYVESHVLFTRKFKFPWRRKWGMLIFGLFLVSMPFLMRNADNEPNAVLFGFIPLGLIALYRASFYHLPQLYARCSYPSTGLQGRQFKAWVSREGIRVQGTHSEWKYGWPAVLLVGESDNMFTFYTGIQIFVFAKRYLRAEQVEAVRQFIAAEYKLPDRGVPQY